MPVGFYYACGLLIICRDGCNLIFSGFIIEYEVLTQTAQLVTNSSMHSKRETTDTHSPKALMLLKVAPQIRTKDFYLIVLNICPHL